LSRTAKLFRNCRSPAVRLPSYHRFEGSEVCVRRDPTTGDVILSRRPESWEDFFDLVKSIEVPSDFLAEVRQSLDFIDTIVCLAQHRTIACC
jgi:antitoxin VapB